MLRPITINPVLNGFVVQFGCQQLAYTDTTKMLGDLGDYLREPEETEKKMLAKECFNRRHTLGSEIPPPPCQDTCATDPARPMGLVQTADARRNQDQYCNGAGAQAGQMIR